jgi:putative ABC transport system permease protein
VQSLIQDLRFAFRMMLKNRAFTIVAVLTLALGIGANCAIFSVVDAVLLQPLPYSNPNRLIYLTGVDTSSGTPGLAVSFTRFTMLRQQSQTLDRIAAFYTTSLSLVTDNQPEAVNAARLSSDFFSVLGVPPALGRDLSPEEETVGAAAVAVITDGFWHSHFAGDERVLGKTLTLDGRPTTIVGVLPPAFDFPLQYPEPDVWIPGISDPSFLRQEQVHSGATYLSVIGKLRPGATLQQAQAECHTLDANYRSDFPAYADSSKVELAASTLTDALVGAARPGLAVLLAAVALILLIACGNVANLLLARATAREREMGLRKALGASSGRLVRQLLIESSVLSLAGGAAGICLAAAILPTLRAVNAGSAPRLANAQLNGPVLLFSMLLCALTGLVFGIVPALQMAGRGELQEILKDGGRGSGGGRQSKMRDLLVVAEIALALVLMTGAGLLLRSFSRLMDVNPGFTTRNLMTFALNLPPGQYDQPELQSTLRRRLIEGVESSPGVQSAALTSYLPLSGNSRFVYFCPEGSVCQGIGKDPLTSQRDVSSEYFDVMHTPLIRGRVFTDGDRASSALVVVVNQTLADRFWPGQDPIGRHLANSRDQLQREVIGVVGDVKFNALSSGRIEEIYLPLEQSPVKALTLIVSGQDAAGLVSAVRARVADIDPNLPVTGIASMNDVVKASVAQPRLVAQFVAVFAAVALLLSAVGIYGLMSYNVSVRKQELGIRMSLGAAARDVLRLVVGQGLRLAALGTVIGIAVSLGLTRLLASQLFQVNATDPATFVMASGALLVAALLACYIPARRATRVDPLTALRYE